MTVVVIGGGPAGMMAAIQAAKNHEVMLLDGNDRIGKKLFITGKGRCNVTNAKDISEFFEFIPGNPYFLYSSLYTFTNKDTMEFFKKQGIELKVERGDRVFPKSDKSSDIIKGLSKALKESDVEIRLNSKATDIKFENNSIVVFVLWLYHHIVSSKSTLPVGCDCIFCRPIHHQSQHEPMIKFLRLGFRRCFSSIKVTKI